MTLPRQSDHPVQDLFLQRWSPRSFTDQTMTEAEMLTLLEAARWAPSASNIQPWRFAWGLRGDAGFAAIAASLAASNRVWAEKAAGLIAVASRTTVQKPEGAVPNRTHGFDTGAAWMSLALQAQMTGWVCHAMGGFDPAAAALSLSLPEDHFIHAVVAVGRQGPKEALPEALQAREQPNGREELGKLAGRGRFPG